MTTIGNTTHIVTLSPSAPVVTITGPITARESAAVYGPAAGVFTIFNESLVAAMGTAELGVGILLAEPGSVFNAGYVSGGNGVEFLSGGTASVAAYVNNGGTIMGYGTVTAGAGLADGPQYGVGVLGMVAGGVVNAGSVSGNNAGIMFRAAGSVANTGVITSSAGYGVLVAARGAAAAGVTNAGLITGLYGVAFYGAGSVGNSGSIIASSIAVEILSAAGVGYNTGLIEAAGGVTAGGTPSGFLLQQAGYFSNASAGVVMAPGGDAVVLRQGGTVVNAGGIYGGQAGILGTADGAGLVVNSSGSVTGSGYGVYLSGAALVTNNGYIGGMGQAPTSSTEHYFSTGLFLTGGTEGVYNAWAGTIFSQRNYAVDIMAITDGPQDAALTNAGLIMGLGGVQFFGLGEVVNYATIIGTAADGIVLHYNGQGLPAGSVENTGLIEASLTAVYANGPAMVMNGVAGVIKAQLYGVRLAGGSMTQVENSGYIGGNVAVEIGRGTVENTGSLVGASLGVAILGGGTLFDGGLIAGGAGGAVYFEAGFYNALVLDPGAEISGKVRFGGGVLELAKGGAKGVVGLKTLAGFTGLTIESGAEWELQGKTSLAKSITVVNDGTIAEASGDSLTIAGALTGAGTVAMAMAKLALNGAVAAKQVIRFGGAGETLALGAPKSFRGKIKNFKLGDTIDLTGVALSAITGLSFASGVLTLTEATGTLHLDFASPNSFGTETFGLVAAGAGVDVTLGKAGALALAWPTASWLPVMTL